MIEHLIIDGDEATIHYPDKLSEEYTIYYSGKGGAIISHQNKNIAIEQWSNAMKIAKAVKKLLQYKNG